MVSNACSRSAIISPAFSIPTDRRIKSGATPASSNCASVICRWVWLAGCRTQVLASATWVTIAIIFNLSIKPTETSLPPFKPKEITPQVPFGMYFCASP